MTKFLMSLVLFVTIFTGCFNEKNQTVSTDDVCVNGEYARAVASGVPNSAVFMKLKNESENSYRLISAKSDASKVVELHNHVNDNGVMRMRKIDGIDIPSKGSVDLSPGGLHIMLIGLNQELKDGNSIKVELEFKDGGKKEIIVPVRTLGISPKEIKNGGRCCNKKAEDCPSVTSDAN